MTRRDPVTPEVAAAVFARDGWQCVLVKLFPEHVCRDRWGGRTLDLTLEHLKDQPRMGKRGPSDVRHLVVLCYGANVGVPSKVEREACRAYLRSFYEEAVA